MDEVVRHAEPADYAALIADLDAWWGGRAMAAMLPRLFFVHFRPTSFVAEVDGGVVGFVCGFVSQTDPRLAYVHFVGVAPGARGAGLGERLCRRFFRAARAAGCREVRCVTSPANRGSVAFHRRMGFEALPGDAEAEGVPVWTAYDGPGEDRVVFRRDLGPEDER